MSKQYDPRMHTAEHVLNGVMDAFLGCGRCFSAHINPKKSKCDYRFQRDLTANEAAEVEARVNAILGGAHPVTESFLPRAEAEARFNLGRLPDDAGETVRIIHIGEHDVCPCIGEHVSNTVEIGHLRIISHDHADGVLRLRFKLEQATA